MTITQTVDIPADRRVRLDFEVPRGVPEGQTNVIIQFPVREKVQPKTADKKIGMTRKELDEILKNAHTPHSDALLGILSGMGDVDLDEIRMERLAKHL